jgi:hypothetical protein
VVASSPDHIIQPFRMLRTSSLWVRMGVRREARGGRVLRSGMDGEMVFDGDELAHDDRRDFWSQTQLW